MWRKERADGAPAKGETGTKDIIAFVGRGVEFKGIITYEGTLRIDGRVEGEIRTGGVLQIGEEAVIDANISVGTAIIKGKVIGDVTATHKVRLLAPASLRGSVQAPVFSIEEGVTFEGTCQMSTGERMAQIHELPREPVLRAAGAPAITRVSG